MDSASAKVHSSLGRKNAPRVSRREASSANVWSIRGNMGVFFTSKCSGKYNAFEYKLYNLDFPFSLYFTPY